MQTRPELPHSEKMSGMMPGDDGFGDNLGWDRASIALNTRQSYNPNVKPEDLVLPSDVGTLRTLWICSVCAFAITILYVFFPLFIVNVFIPMGDWYGVVLAGAFLVLIPVLFFFAVRETRQLRRLASDL